MMKYILIILLWNAQTGVHTTTIPFENSAACCASLGQVLDERMDWKIRGFETTASCINVKTGVSSANLYKDDLKDKSWKCLDYEGFTEPNKRNK